MIRRLVLCALMIVAVPSFGGCNNQGPTITEKVTPPDDPNAASEAGDPLASAEPEGPQSIKGRVGGGSVE